jgi:hypothetical protein
MLISGPSRVVNRPLLFKTKSTQVIVNNSIVLPPLLVGCIALFDLSLLYLPYDNSQGNNDNTAN